MSKIVLSLLVNNETGVTSRISGLFTRRGFNIEGITAGVTTDPHISRITVAVEADEDIREQVIKQLGKLEDVIEIEELEAGNSVFRELILVKVGVNEIQRPEIISIADIFRAKIVGVNKTSMMIELTGDTPKIEAFLELLVGYEIISIARTGLTGLGRN